MPTDDRPSRSGPEADDGAPTNEQLERMLDGLLGTADQPDSSGGSAGLSMEPSLDSQPLDGPIGSLDDTGDHPKVELDTDDAPFLEEEKEPESADVAAAGNNDSPQEAGSEEAPGFFRKLLADKKRLAIAAGAGLFILIAPLIVLLVFGGKQTVEPPLPPEPAVREEAPQPPVTVLPEQRYVFESAPYLVPLRGSEGEPRFLHLRFTLVMDSQLLFAELKQKSILIRDAVYHYLSNKPLTLISGPEQVNLLRSDLINVINQHLGADKITELNFEEYFITGT